jgi:hypothetical protein
MEEQSNNKSARELELEKKKKELEAALEEEKFRTKFLNTMLDIIERDYNVPPRKRPE